MVNFSKFCKRPRQPEADLEQSTYPESEQYNKLAEHVEGIISSRIGDSSLPRPDVEDEVKIIQKEWETALRELKSKSVKKLVETLNTDESINMGIKNIQDELSSLIHKLVYHYEKNPAVYVDFLARVLFVLFTELENVDKPALLEDNRPKSANQIKSEKNEEFQDKETAVLALDEIIKQIEESIYANIDLQILYVEISSKSEINEIFRQMQNILKDKFNALYEDLRKNQPSLLSHLFQKKQRIEAALADRKRYYLNNIKIIRQIIKPDIAILKRYREQKILPRLNEKVEAHTFELINEAKLETKDLHSIDEIGAIFEECINSLQAFIQKLRDDIEIDYANDSKLKDLLIADLMGMEAIMIKRIESAETDTINKLILDTTPPAKIKKKKRTAVYNFFTGNRLRRR